MHEFHRRTRAPRGTVTHLGRRPPRVRCAAWLRRRPRALRGAAGPAAGPRTLTASSVSSPALPRTRNGEPRKPRVSTRKRTARRHTGRHQTPRLHCSHQSWVPLQRKETRSSTISSPNNVFRESLETVLIKDALRDVSELVATTPEDDEIGAIVTQGA